MRGFTVYNPADYWSARLRRYGHTGFRDIVKHRYSQSLRLSAVRRVVTRLGLVTVEGLHVLDAGCGTGDFTQLFLEMGARVTGIDASPEVAEYAKERFRNINKVSIRVGWLEALNLPDKTFDIVLTVTVLQHIVDHNNFLSACKNLLRVTKSGGHILIFELSPTRISKRWEPAPHLKVRTRDEIVKAFQNNGAVLIYEKGVPELGIRMLSWLDQLFRRMPNNFITSLLYQFLRFFSAKTCKILDYLFIMTAFPSSHSDMRICVFERNH